MARIVTVYANAREPWAPIDMGHIRWLEMSAALARQGHRVDIATNEPRWLEDPSPVEMAPGLRRVPLSLVNWREYSAIKTLFHRGFETVEEMGGARHPLIIAKLGSVVAGEDRPGIHFHGAIREHLYRVQQRVHRKARFVTVLSKPAITLWHECHGERAGILLVPGAASSEIPPAGPNPYAELRAPVCIFSGNIYDAGSQPEANQVLTAKLNELGAHVGKHGLRLVFQGPGDASGLDPRHVTCLSPCEYSESWNYLRHAAVGVVVSAGPFMHNNESTKIYHYLRAGLPVVSEPGFPNDHVVRDSGLGFVAPSNQMDGLAAKVIEAAFREWDRDAAIRYALDNHTWDCRARAYATVLPAGDLPGWRYRWFGI